MGFRFFEDKDLFPANYHENFVSGFQTQGLARLAWDYNLVFG